MKKNFVNPEVAVRRMMVKNIVTTSMEISSETIKDQPGSDWEIAAPARQGGVATSADGGVAPVRAGF